MEQRTQDWFQARLGKVTASKVSDSMAKPDTATYRNYLMQLVAERLTNEPQDTFTNSAMEWGTEKEPDARNAYELIYGLDVEEVGFIDHPVILNFGASPDGLVGDKGLIEIKCPKTTTHIDYMESGKIPPKYVKQMQVQLMCTQREWCDFVSFDPRLPADIQLWVKRYEYDEKLAKKIEDSVTEFLDNVDKTIKKIRG